MERIMKSQALADNSSMGYMSGKKNLEINPHHPIIQELRLKLQDEENKRVAKDLIHLLYDTSLVNSGFTLDETTNFSNRIFNIIGLGLGLEPNAPSEEVSEEVVANEEVVDEIDPSGLLKSEMPTVEEEMEEVD